MAMDSGADPQRGPTAGAAPKSESRRSFLQLFVAGSFAASAASFFYPVLRYVMPPRSADLGSDTVVAGTVGDLKANSAKIFKFGSRPGLLVRMADGEYRAMSATCTHLSCTVQYKPDTRQVWCACHNGMYDLSGKNVSGPPPRPLEAFDVHVQGNEIIVARRREG
jgi:Rieske Fe-S protein